MKILVTGGASGLGKGITLQLASTKEHTVFFTYCHSKDAAAEIERQYKNTHSKKVDFEKEEDIQQLIAFMQEANIDVLINNAISWGINKKHFHKMTDDDFMQGITRNVLPVLSITRAAIEMFREKKFGKIVTILTSSLVNKPPVGYSEYTAGKAYLLSMSKSWANENASFNISSNCISPAFMQTGLTNDTDERIIEDITAKHPLKALLSTEDVAKAAEFFVNASQHYNGVNLIINAGSDVI